MNINDNIGARYAMMALLEGFKNNYEFEEIFLSKTGLGLDAFIMEEWFERAIEKHKDRIEWWLKEL